jgi:methyl-accepting chemotaxis protein
MNGALMSFRKKLYALAGLGLFSSLLIALVGMYAEGKLVDASSRQLLISSALKNHMDVDMMHDAIRGDILATLLAASKNDHNGITKAKSDLNEHSDNIRASVEANSKLELDSDVKRLLSNLEPVVNSYVVSAGKLISSAEENTADAEKMLPDFMTAFESLEDEAGKVATKIEEISLLREKENSDAIHSVQMLSWAILIVSAFGLVIFSIYTIKNILNQLGGDPSILQSAAIKVSAGDYSVELPPSNQSSVMAAMETMIASIKTNMAAAAHNQRIKNALDVTSSNVMLADASRNIIYMNKSVEKMLRAVEGDLRKDLPHFAVDKVIGSNMDIFHKNPSHQINLLNSLNSTHVSNIQVADRKVRLTTNPIFSESGERLGSVVEWLDRTAEMAAESEVSDLVSAAATGKFSIRIDTAGKDGFFLKLAEGLNQLVNTADKGLNDVARVLGAIAKGDLTERVTADYSGTFGDLKNYCNDTTESLTTMLGDIRNAAEMIFTASSEIAQGNADLSSRTEQQAANLEETASSMEELTSTVKLNADNAKQANVLAERASSVATDGGSLIQKVVITMNDINQSARKISDIIGVIDGIAFQTNILALNAAVEAARAGDQGRGFAVVASEVRTLAQRSANAAKDIKALINDSVQKIESGNSLVNKSGETMKDIVDSIKRVNDIMSEIAAASNEQSTGIEEVSTAVSQMDEMTQQNAALVEEAAAAAESLQSQADQLSRSVAQFKLSNDQQSRSTSAPRLAAPSKENRQTISSAKSTRKLAPPKSNAEDEWETF